MFYSSMSNATKPDFFVKCWLFNPKSDQSQIIPNTNTVIYVGH